MPKLLEEAEAYCKKHNILDLFESMVSILNISGKLFANQHTDEQDLNSGPIQNSSNDQLDNVEKRIDILTVCNAPDDSKASNIPISSVDISDFFL